VVPHITDFVWINDNIDGKELFVEGLRNDGLFTFAFPYNWSIKPIEIIEKIFQLIIGFIE